MADDNDKKDPDKGDPKKPDDDQELGEAGKRALEAERRARREALQKLADVQKRLDEIEDKDKSELQKANDRATTAEKRAAEAESKLTRYEVAMSRGLKAGQAKFLVGTTKEELEAAADELLAEFGGGKKDDTDGDKDGDKPTGPPSAKPKPTLRGGSDPTSEPEEMDPRKLAGMIPKA